MPVKYQCPRCEKRFVEWGAKKVSFKCPDCGDEELVRVGANDERLAKRPTLKRRKPVVKRPESFEEEDLQLTKGGEGEEIIDIRSFSGGMEDAYESGDIDITAAIGGGSPGIPDVIDFGGEEEPLAEGDGDFAPVPDEDE